MYRCHKKLKVNVQMSLIICKAQSLLGVANCRSKQHASNNFDLRSNNIVIQNWRLELKIRHLATKTIVSSHALELKCSFTGCRIFAEKPQFGKSVIIR